MRWLLKLIFGLALVVATLSAATWAFTFLTPFAPKAREALSAQLPPWALPATAAVAKQTAPIPTAPDHGAKPATPRNPQ
ncbi:MAG: hypothetical protein HY719_15420, partial [Planctomycetes bacterium]|nr:hypothetical protein [Planctomycetota bacterium]